MELLRINPPFDKRKQATASSPFTLRPSLFSFLPMSLSRCLCFSFLLAASAGGVLAEVSPDLEKRLQQLPTPWVQPIHRLTFEEYDATMKHWAAKHPSLVTLQKRGESHDGQPIYLLKVTDSRVPDTDKQVVMVSALHGGPERSGVSTILSLTEWLLGDSAVARETRRKQIVLLMPVLNPHALFKTDRFGNKEGVELYDPQRKWWNLKTLTLTDPAKAPELVAFLSVMDEYRPENHLDLHGTGLQGYKPEELPEGREQRQGMTMFEVSACSYSNCCVRPWDPRVTEAMVQAGVAAGYGSDRTEADAQRTFWHPELDFMKEKLWIPPRTDRFRTMFYSYLKYHTMISTTEVGWEESGVARVRGILELGNKQWLDERFSGYPVTRVKARAGRYITAYGNTAAERRESRVELWNAQGKYVDGVFYAEFAGRTSYVVAVTPAGVAALDTNKEKFVANLRALPGVNAEAIGRYLKDGPEIRLSGDHKSLGESARVRNGIGFRLRIPYRSPKMLDVSVNGHSLRESATDGYQAFYADGYTHLQINVPPEKSREADLFVVTCAYDPRETRTYGFEPPEAVKKQLQGRK